MIRIINVFLKDLYSSSSHKEFLQNTLIDPCIFCNIKDILEIITKDIIEYHQISSSIKDVLKEILKYHWILKISLMSYLHILKYHGTTYRSCRISSHIIEYLWIFMMSNIREILWDIFESIWILVNSNDVLKHVLKYLQVS